MENILVTNIYRNSQNFMHQQVKVSGWVRSVRTSKVFGFIEMNDGSCFNNIQIVYDNSLPNFEQVDKLSVGSSLIAEGQLIPSQGKEQAFELKASSIEIVGFASLDNPIQKKRHSFEFLRTVAHLRPRTNTFKAVFRVRSLLAHAIHKFFQERDFVYVHTPIITSSDAEGAGEMFRVSTLDLMNLPRNEENKIDYTQELFGKETFLTVSGQLAVEPYCFGFRNVYTFGPTFRAENSNTARHANEFWMIEPEIAFADLNDNMKLAEDMMKYVISYLFNNAQPELDFCNQFVDNNLIHRLEGIVNSKFEAMTYTEAVAQLKKANKKFDYPVEWGDNLQTEHERYISEELCKKPVFVTDYPKDIKAFYMKQNSDGKTVRAMDLLVPEIGEIIGGSQREERLDVLEARMKELEMNPEHYWWYMDVRRYGTFPHAGFGLGFERAVMYLTGMKNIRDVIPYPRTPNQASF